MDSYRRVIAFRIPNRKHRVEAGALAVPIGDHGPDAQEDVGLHQNGHAHHPVDRGRFEWPGYVRNRVQAL